MLNTRPHPRGPFRADIMSGTSASSQGQLHQWLREHCVDFSITEFELVWSNRHGHAVFLGRRSDGWPFVVNPWARDQAAELSWGTDDIAEI